MRTLLSLLTAITLALPATAQLKETATEPHAKKPLTMREEMMRRTSSAKYSDILGRHGNGPAQGAFAPDFIFEPLEDYDFGTLSSKSAETPIRLSDFKGHKPVVLIFGSYT